uniref:Uncharacterized protein n=1 Tax=Streptomyces sp. NBC_01393 TaxID=2903851 RepID=A0AAU3I9J4_9ACTN
MSTYHRTAYDEALDAMLEAGIDRPRADELLMAVCDMTLANHEISQRRREQKPPVVTGEVLVKDLVIGDIIEERYPNWSRRKIVTNITDKSAVFRTDNGQDGRAALTSKRKGKVTDNKVVKVGHYYLTDRMLSELSSWYTMGDLRRARWQRGLLEDLPPFHEIFGYASREEMPFASMISGEIVDTVTVAHGVRVNIKRYPNENTVMDGKTVPVTSWGAAVVDPDHDHEFGVLGWRYRDQETARKVVDMLDHALRTGCDLEMATRMVCQVGNDALPLVDRDKPRKAI